MTWPRRGNFHSDLGGSHVDIAFDVLQNGCIGGDNGRMICPCERQTDFKCLDFLLLWNVLGVLNTLHHFSR